MTFLLFCVIGIILAGAGAGLSLIAVFVVPKHNRDQEW